jgi:hypothetical protein
MGYLFYAVGTPVKLLVFKLRQYLLAGFGGYTWLIQQFHTAITYTHKLYYKLVAKKGKA